MSLPSATVRPPRSIAIVVVFFTLALAHTAIAQELSAIIGQVRDESGAVLPGVTVSVSSPVLQVKQVTDVTNVQGEYRITPLPIGTYTVSYQLDGFSSMRQEGIRLDLGATVRLDIALKIGTLQETLTVSGAAPVVDVTATSASTQFTRETLELTPTSRNGAISLMVQAPGVRAPGRLDVGGGTVGDTPEFSSFGQPIESFMVMEGLVTSDSRIQTQGGNYFDYNAMEEAKVQTISNGPDVPSRGPALSMLLKSGGNEFHGGASYAYSSQHTEGNNVDDELRAQGITEGNPLLSRTDQGGDFGGRIIRDKLWFYGSARYRPQDVVQLGVFKPDGTPGNGYKAEIITNQKISYQLRQASKLVFWNTWVQKYHYADTHTRFQAWESRLDRIPPIRASTWKAEWQEVRGNSLVMSFLFGRWTWTGGQNANFVGPTDAATAAGVPQGLEIRMGNDESHGGGRPSRFDQTSQWQDGQSANGGSWNDIWRYTSKATATYFKPDLFKGNHEFKAGFEVHAQPVHPGEWRPRSRRTVPPDLHRRRNGTGWHPDADRALQLSSHTAEQRGIHDRVWRRHVDDCAATDAGTGRPLRARHGERSEAMPPGGPVVVHTGWVHRKDSLPAAHVVCTPPVFLVRHHRQRDHCAQGWLGPVLQTAVHGREPDDQPVCLGDVHVPVARPQWQSAVRPRRSE